MEKDGADRTTFRAPDPAFWRGRRVLLTGHTGFKGAWFALWLGQLGAKVSGVSLDPETAPSLYGLLQPWPELNDLRCDIRDLEKLTAIIRAVAPEIVVHMAAQAIVITGYDDPVATITTNVIGTCHLLEAIRSMPDIRAALIVTSDKVYANDQTGRSFLETDRLGGDDPYSASKAASEIVTAAYAKSFFNKRQAAIATARAGNVIGGGDWSDFRLIPDLLRAIKTGTPMELRYPKATRPWQHVLDALAGYLVYLEDLVLRPDDCPRTLNFGPSEGEQTSVEDACALMMKRLGGAVEDYIVCPDVERQPEKLTLGLDATLAQEVLGWRPMLLQEATFDWIAQWHQHYLEQEPMRRVTLGQITSYGKLLAGQVL